jgi:hypothetical protein
LKHASQTQKQHQIKIWKIFKSGITQVNIASTVSGASADYTAVDWHVRQES